jgi:hypothetical protein
MERFPFLFRDTTITINTIQVFVLAKSSDFDASTLNISLTPQKGKDSPSSQFTFTGNKFLTGKERLLDDATSPIHGWILTQAPAANQLQIAAWLAGTPHGRLGSGTVEDVLLICQYTCGD